jgi:hypothetical protein
MKKDKTAMGIVTTKAAIFGSARGSTGELALMDGRPLERDPCVETLFKQQSYGEA